MVLQRVGTWLKWLSTVHDILFCEDILELYLYSLYSIILLVYVSMWLHSSILIMTFLSDESYYVIILLGGIIILPKSRVSWVPRLCSSFSYYWGVRFFTANRLGLSTIVTPGASHAAWHTQVGKFIFFLRNNHIHSGVHVYFHTHTHAHNLYLIEPWF